MSGELHRGRRLLAAALLTAAVGCSKSGSGSDTTMPEEGAASGTENSAGSYPGTTTTTPGTDATGVGATGADALEVPNASTPSPSGAP